MSSSEARAVHFVELAIVAQEGALVVDGVPYLSTVDAELARTALAERAVAEASLLCRYVSLYPTCAWCGKPITDSQRAREINRRLYHDDFDIPCALEFSDACEDYATERAAVADAR